MADADADHSVQQAMTLATIANLSRRRRCNGIRMLAARPCELVRSRPLFMVNITKF
jgi:hypothetical protein